MHHFRDTGVRSFYIAPSLTISALYQVTGVDFVDLLHELELHEYDSVVKGQGSRFVAKPWKQFMPISWNFWWGCNPFFSYLWHADVRKRSRYSIVIFNSDRLFEVETIELFVSVYFFLGPNSPEVLEFSKRVSKRKRLYLAKEKTRTAITNRAKLLGGASYCNDDL